MISNENLKRVAWQTGLIKYLVRDNEVAPGREVSATLLEAVLGAIWQDCEDIVTVKRALIRLGFENLEDIAEDRTPLQL